jgi:hypothetical protein
MGKRKRLSVLKEIERLFPKLGQTGYQVKSRRTKKYNCLAWAAGDTANWWEPGGRHYWPNTLARAYSPTAYTQVFTALGYVICDSDDLEDGFEKVALFVNEFGEPTHAARQLPSGRWTSKLGKLEDIEHDLRDLEGTEYGTVVLILKRPLPPTA